MAKILIEIECDEGSDYCDSCELRNQDKCDCFGEFLTWNGTGYMRLENCLDAEQKATKYGLKE